MNIPFVTFKPLEEELDKDFHQLADDAGHRPEEEATEEDRQLAQVQFIEGRGKKEGDFQQHQYAAEGGTDGRHGDVPGRGDGAAGLEQPLRADGDEQQSREHREADEEEGQVFLYAYKQVGHSGITSNKKSPEEIIPRR